MDSKKKVKKGNWERHIGIMKDVFPHHTADQITEWQHAMIAGDIDNPIVKEFDEIYFKDRVDKNI